MIINILLMIILAVMALWFIAVVHDLKAKVENANLIRIGYEKKYNSFRIKYTMLSGLEHYEKVLEKVGNIQKPIYIFGGGVVGNKFIRMLKVDNSIKVLRVIESNELKADPEIGKYLHKDALIIITPMFDYDNIIRLMNECHFPMDNVVGLDEFL